MIVAETAAATNATITSGVRADVSFVHGSTTRLLLAPSRAIELIRSML